MSKRDNTDSCAELLKAWLARRASAETLAWLDAQLVKISTGDKRALFVAFGVAPRKTGKDDLSLSDDEMASASETRPGWTPQQWTVDQAARTLLVLSFPADDAQAYVATLDELFRAGEVSELVALYQALPLLPHPESHVWRTTEGIRTNIKAVFCAVVHDNPYPSEQLDEERWNQMVLKCLFVGAALDPVIGLDERSNPELARMLVDFAHERWAASRDVCPELWRPVGLHADQTALADLKRALDDGTPIERQAVALALASCPQPEAKNILSAAPELVEQIQSGEITWSGVAADCYGS